MLSLRGKIRQSGVKNIGKETWVIKCEEKKRGYREVKAEKISIMVMTQSIRNATKLPSFK